MRQYETLRDMRDYSSLRNPESFRTVHISLRAYHPKAEAEREQKRAERQAKYDERYYARMERNAQRRAEIIEAREDKLGERKARELGKYIKLDKKLHTQTERESVKQRKRIAKEALREKLRQTERQTKLEAKTKAVKEAEHIMNMGRRSIEFTLTRIMQQLERAIKPYFRKTADNGPINEILSDLRANIKIEIDTAIEQINEYTTKAYAEKYQEAREEILDVAHHIIDVYDFDVDTVVKICGETIDEYVEGRITKQTIASTALKRAEYESRRVTE